MTAWLWGILIGLGLLLETAALWSKNDRLYPLTYYIRKWVPKVIIALALAWLAQHFLGG